MSEQIEIVDAPEARRFELDSASLSLIAADGSRLAFVPDFLNVS